MRIGIVADRGQPADDVAFALRRLGQDRGDGSAGVDVETVTGTFPLTKDGEVHLERYADALRRARGWDRLIYVTDLPLTALNRPLVSRRSVDGRDLLISTPAFGAVRARRRITRELRSLLTGDGPVFGVERQVRDDDGVIAHARVLDHLGRSLRLIGGMVRANQPGSLLPVMTGSLAAMAATGGFGVFYGSIWNLSEAMGVWRLLLLAVLSVAVLSAWLIVRNRLWIRRATESSRWRESIDNIVTILTVTSTVMMMFLLAAVAMAVLSMIVVPRDYLSGVLDSPPSWGSYLRIGWLSAALGTFAGAIGSNFDRAVEIRSAVYTVREYERRRAVGDRIEQAEEEGRLGDEDFLSEMRLKDTD